MSIIVGIYGGPGPDPGFYLHFPYPARSGDITLRQP
jgi:hypothetical protein